ncbi:MULTISPECIES: carboxymuconolactone decarboxylase family protein [unclassified Geodermatophilus]
MTQTTPDATLDGLARGDAPVLETVLAMNLDALDRSGLDADTYLLVRLAVLVAMDAPPASYAVTLGMAADTDVTVEQAQAVLVAIAPLVGTPRITAAAGNILRAIAGAEALAEAIPEQRTS